MPPRSRIIPFYRNFALVLVLECCWALGMHMAHPMTVMPNFFLRLGASPVIIGLLPAFWAFGTGIGSLGVGPAAAHRRRLTIFAGIWHYVAMIPYLGLAAVALLSRGRLALAGARAVALGLLLAFNLIMGFLMQIYFVILSRVFPESMRGRWFGAVFSLSSLLSLIGPWLAADYFLGEAPDMKSYARIFAASVILFALGTVAFFFLREAPARPWPRRTIYRNLLHLYRLWSRNVPLRRYMTSRIWLEVGVLSGAFFTTYSRTEAGMGETFVTWLGMLVIICHAVMSLALGWLSGHLEKEGAAPRQAYLQTQWLIQAVRLGTMAFAAAGPARPAALLLALSAGIGITSELVVHPNILLEMGVKRLRTDMITLGAVTLMPATLVLPPLGGFLIGKLGHRMAFGLAALAGLPGLYRLGRLCFSPRPRDIVC